MINQKLPLVTKDLLEYLEKLFPDRCPDPDQSDRDIWISVGSVRVVKKLRQMFEAQTLKALKGD